MNNLTNEQLLFLDNLIYLKLDSFEHQSVASIIADILTDVDNNIQDKAAEMTTEQWVDLLESFAYAKDENGNFKTDSTVYNQMHIDKTYACIDAPIQKRLFHSKSLIENFINSKPTGVVSLYTGDTALFNFVIKHKQKC
ncbi:MAG: hypothetical protein UH080_03925 [Ruminococcus sp.]|nr:hypothetical protein [Ruminococcus sp.]